MNDITKDAGWFDKNMQDPDFRRHYERETAAEGFLERIEEVMRARQVTRTRLADLMGCKPANITRVMRRSNNLTLSTMVDMALALNHRVHIFVEAAIDGAILGPSAEPRAWSAPLTGAGVSTSAGGKTAGADRRLRAVPALPAGGEEPSTCPMAA